MAKLLPAKDLPALLVLGMKKAPAVAGAFLISSLIVQD
jgi:hypothetical protein